MSNMKRIIHLILVLLPLSAGPAGAENISAEQRDIQLSPELIELLRAEMRAILAGVQSLPAGIATADWESVADTGASIKESYLLKQQLTPGQKKELGTALPEHFRRLDAHFHLEAGKLEAAATSHDAQLTAFHYYRLIETCTACHMLYAPARFPGFSTGKIHTHEH